MTKLKVKLPKWFVQEVRLGYDEPAVYGFTDGKSIANKDKNGPTCYFVDVPDFDYAGYFKLSDLVIVGKETGLSVRRK